MTKKVILWTCPRCNATAFQRCILNLENTNNLHEALSLAYYTGPEKRSSRYENEQVDEDKTYENAIKVISSTGEGADLVFIKDLAYYIEDRFDILLREDMKSFQHTFMIRDPIKQIKSFYKASTDKEKTGWDYFDPHEVGYKQLLDLYNFVKENIDPTPVLLDADDFLADPEGIMKVYCDKIGVNYKDGMTKWEPGPVKEWDEWAPGWYDTLFSSSGIISKPKSTTPLKVEGENFPPVVYDTIEKNMEYYTALYEETTIKTGQSDSWFSSCAIS